MCLCLCLGTRWLEQARWFQSKPATLQQYQEPLPTEPNRTHPTEPNRSSPQILPMENTAGRDLVEGGKLCERKNGRGVDPNRNWAVDWGRKEKDYDPAEEFPGRAPLRCVGMGGVCLCVRCGVACGLIRRPGTAWVGGSVLLMQPHLYPTDLTPASPRSSSSWPRPRPSSPTCGSTSTLACTRCSPLTTTKHRCGDGAWHGWCLTCEWFAQAASLLCAPCCRDVTRFGAGNTAPVAPFLTHYTPYPHPTIHRCRTAPTPRQRCGCCGASTT
jgi:hypothetical protein